VERGLIQEVGRDEGPGRAILYGTTAEFLERLGLASLSNLPPLAPLLRDGDHETAAVGD
jgi:segregation and condensation protein B